MKSIIVIFVLSAYLFSTTSLNQLLKIPVLISHFIDHKGEDADMSFVDYMIHHYGGHEKDADWETDMQLPFMQHSELLNVLVIPGNAYPDLAKRPPHPISGQTVLHQDDDIPCSYLSSIWQPPKF